MKQGGKGGFAIQGIQAGVREEGQDAVKGYTPGAVRAGNIMRGDGRPCALQGPVFRIYKGDTGGIITPATPM